MDRLTNIQRIKIIKTYYKNCYDRWTATFRTKFSSAMKNSSTVDSLTNIQRLKISKTYYKNGNSVTASYRALREDYGLHIRPTMQAIGKIVKKFEKTVVVTNVETPVHHRFAENIAIVKVLDSSYFAFRSTPTSI